MIFDLHGIVEASEVAGSSPKYQHLDNIISFSDDDIKKVQTPHNDAIIVSMIIVKYDVKKF